MKQVKFGCCLPAASYDLLVKAGYDAISLAAAEIAELSEQEMNDLCAKIQSGPLICQDTNAFCKPHIKLAGPDYSPEALRAYAQPLMERAQRLGIKSIGIGSPNSRRLPDGFDKDVALAQFREALLLLSHIAKPHGIRILAEAVSTAEGNFITTTQEALEVLAGLPKGEIGLVYDIYHAAMMEESIEWFVKASSYIEVVHISQDIDGKRSYLQEKNADTYAIYAKALTAIGYTGVVSIEAMYGNPEEELAPSLALLQKAWA